MLHLLLAPALLLQVQAPPPVQEVASGVYILKGVPGPETYLEIKRLHITHVFDFRGDGELPADPSKEPADLHNVGAEYVRYALGTAPPDADFAFVCDLLKGLPHGARILLHCADGNRAAAAACPWLVMARGMKADEAVETCKRAGLVRPDTLAALKRYLEGVGHPKAKG